MKHDDPGFAELLEHLVVDFAQMTPETSDHVRGLVYECVEHGPGEAFLAVTAVTGLTASVLRAAFADHIAAVRAHSTDPFWGLEVDAKPGENLDDPLVRCAIAAHQAMVATLNDDLDTAAAVVQAIVKHPDRGPEESAHLLLASLRLFRGLYNTPEGRAGWEAVVTADGSVD
jgi:hypothetical protein